MQLRRFFQIGRFWEILGDRPPRFPGYSLAKERLLQVTGALRVWLANRATIFARTCAAAQNRGKKFFRGAILQIGGAARGPEARVSGLPFNLRTHISI